MKTSRWFALLLLGALLAQGVPALGQGHPRSAAMLTREVVSAPSKGDAASTYPNTWTLHRPQNPFPKSTHSNSDDVRIEYEVKLRVPLEEMEAVWAWLQMRYADPSWLNRDGYVYDAEFGDEDFTDTYFDTPDLRLLAMQGGIRHRVRVVHTGPADDKDGRELLQVKLDRGDVTGIARSEIKFEVARPGDGTALDETHPFLSLVKKNQQEAVAAVFHSLNANPYEMRPVVTLLQNRRRIYLSDQDGAFATLTLDLCSTNSWGANLRWSEVELELNEIRYTEADEGDRQRMAVVISEIQADLQWVFPSIVSDQTPKYNTAFTTIEATTWLPVRQLIQWRMSITDFIIIVPATLVTVGGALWYVGSRWWRRLRRERPSNRLRDTAYRPL